MTTPPNPDRRRVGRHDGGDGAPGRGDRRHDDSGAALLLAIGFVLMIGAISAGLASLVTSGINNQITLVALRDRQYSADGAIESAITSVRNRLTASPSDCSVGSGSTTFTSNDVMIHVDWQNACGVARSEDGLVVAQRDVIFGACVDAGKPCADTDIIIRAQVNFEQDPSGAITHTYVQAWSVHQ